MALMDKSKLLSFAKRAATPPPAAKMLLQKRALAKAPTAAPPGAPPAPAPEGGEDQEMFLSELVEEAAQEAEQSADPDLEMAIGGHQSQGSDDPPPFAEDPAKWKEAAQAVGLGDPDMEARYDEPFVVAAYLYKKLGGPVTGMEVPPPPEAPDGSEQETDMSKPGAAAKALHAKMAGKPPAAPAAAGKGAAPAGNVAEAAGAKPPPAKGVIGNPALKKHPHALKAAKEGGADGAVAPAATGKSAPASKDAPAKGAGSAKPPAEGAAGEGGDAEKVLAASAHQATTSPDPELHKLLAGYDPERDGNPPEWASDGDTWSKAEEAVEPHWDDYEEPYAVVAHVYKNLGGAVKPVGGSGDKS